jgi:hypothetical protein
LSISVRNRMCSCAGIALVIGAPVPALATSATQTRMLTSVSNLQCPSRTLCVGAGVGGPNLVTSRAPRRGTDGWSAETIDGGQPLKLLTCASPNWCLAVDHGDRVLTSTSPARGAGAWRLAPGGRAGHLDNVEGLSCPTPRLCIGVAGHYVITSTHPNRGGAAWQQALVNQDAPADSIDCPSSALCLAAGVEGQVLISRDPTARHAWRHAALESPRRAAGPASVSCASNTRCVVSEPGGDVFSTTNLDAAVVTWHRAHVGLGLRGARPPLSRFASPALMVSCTAADVCAAAGGGSVWASPAPGGAERRRWTRVVTGAHAAPITDRLISIACVSGQLCVATDSGGHALSATAVTRPGAWREQTIGRPLIASRFHRRRRREAGR